MNPMTEQEKFEAWFTSDSPEIIDMRTRYFANLNLDKFDEDKTYKGVAAFAAWLAWQEAVKNREIPECLYALKGLLTAVMNIVGITRIPRIRDCITAACSAIDKTATVTGTATGTAERFEIDIDEETASDSTDHYHDSVWDMAREYEQANPHDPAILSREE